MTFTSCSSGGVPFVLAVILIRTNLALTGLNCSTSLVPVCWPLTDATVCQALPSDDTWSL